MNSLIASIKQAQQTNGPLPFTVFSSLKEQRIVNVPIPKPMLIVVLDGEKNLGLGAEVKCTPGNFIFLSNSAALDMRNIPGAREYCAIIVEFEFSDFTCFSHKAKTKVNYFSGTFDVGLQQLLQQLIDSAGFLPASLWHLRRAEILQYLDVVGFQQVRSMAASPGLSHQLQALIGADLSRDLGITELCAQVAMSESTLRRKLHAEGTSLQEIKDQTRLGFGLYLLQTSARSVGEIADQCGYQSQSRFAERFKQRFGLTPTELRKTQLPD